MVSLEYIAGFFDGEGWITFSKLYTSNGTIRNGWQLKVGIGNTNPKPLAAINELYPGMFGLKSKVKNKDHWKRCWMWVRFGTNAADFLTDILPLLIIKREEAELAIKIQQHTILYKDRFRSYSRAPTAELEHIMAERNAMVAEVSAMKKRIHTV